MCEGNIDQLPLTCPQLGDLACTQGMGPDWELKEQPLPLEDSTQSTEPHQPGLILVC